MDIEALMQDIEEVYNDEDFIIMLESHIHYLITNSKINVIAVASLQNYQYEGDFYGLLNFLNLDQKYHYLTMRVNGLSSSSDYKGDKDNVLIPAISELELLKNVYLSKK